jgi:exosortase
MSQSIALAGSRPAAVGPLRWRLPGRATAVILVVLIAYNYSLGTLLRGISLQTPLGYLALVPIIALVLGWMRLAREPSPLPVHDRHLDYIAGLGLLALATAIAVVAPGGVAFWLGRYDLLGLPFFVAGLVALFYGARRLWALKVPILFLFLAWPVPYAPLLGDGMRAFASLTASAVAATSRFVPVAHVAPGDDTLFYVGQGVTAFPVSISSACAGVNGLVGFLLVGGALAYAVRGPTLRRATWLAAGLLLTWLLNVVRIETIFVVGATYGRALALDVLHPVAGLAVFNIGVFAMLLLAEPAGLRFTSLPPPSEAALRRTVPVRRIDVPLLVAVNLAVVLAVVNAGYARFEAISGDLGQARLSALDINQVAVPGWELAYVGRFDQATQFFGGQATWDRVLYSSPPTASLSSSIPVYLDVIDTDDPGAFAAYGLEACYEFHGYRIEKSTTVDLGAGITAQVIDYSVPRGKEWSAVWWEWPYARGGTTWYQRMVVFVSGGPEATFRTADGPLAGGDRLGSDRFAATDRFLVSLASEIVRTKVAQTASP